MKNAFFPKPMLPLVVLLSLACQPARAETPDPTQLPSPGAQQWEDAETWIISILTSIRTKIAAGRYLDARREATQLIQRAKNEAGINIKRPDPVDAGLLLEDTDLFKRFEALTARKQHQISRAADGMRMGRYFDRINLVKRAHAYYLQALYLERINGSTTGGKPNYLPRDERFLIDRIFEAHSVPTYVKSPTMGMEYYVCFDRELAEDVDQYEFNRDLLDLALSLKKATESGAPSNEPVFADSSAFEKALADFESRTIDRQYKALRERAKPAPESEADKNERG